ncbi:MAG: FeoA family protein [Candidatus Delongbacteria bacterium]
MTLAALKPGEEALILTVSGEGAIARRMADMGVVPGQHVRMLRVAPLGDPLELQVMGYHLSLRKAEALRVQVRPLEHHV